MRDRRRDVRKGDRKMDKETRILIASLGTPLIVAFCGWINACSEVEKAKAAKYDLADGFQAYIEDVMEGKECPPCETRCESQELGHE